MHNHYLALFINMYIAKHIILYNNKTIANNKKYILFDITIPIFSEFEFV